MFEKSTGQAGRPIDGVTSSDLKLRVDGEHAAVGEVAKYKERARTGDIILAVDLSV